MKRNIILRRCCLSFTQHKHPTHVSNSPRKATPSACPVNSGVVVTTACTAAAPASAAYLLYVLPAATAADTAAPLTAATGAAALGPAPYGTALRTTARGRTVRRKASTSEMVSPLPPNDVLLRLVMLAVEEALAADGGGRHSSTLSPSCRTMEISNRKS